jgi:hypothetical protein
LNLAIVTQKELLFFRTLLERMDIRKYASDFLSVESSLGKATSARRGRFNKESAIKLADRKREPRNHSTGAFVKVATRSSSLHQPNTELFQKELY